MAGICRSQTSSITRNLTNLNGIQLIIIEAFSTANLLDDTGTVDSIKKYFKPSKPLSTLESWWWRSRNLNLRAGKLALAFEHDWTLDDKIGTPVLSSAHINSDCKFEQQYGFFEARIKVVYPEGRQSAFWLNSNYVSFRNYERNFMMKI